MTTLPTPSQLFARFERGEIERDELQAMMALHARELIREMEEDRMNPAAAWLEHLQSRRAAAKWTRRHGGRLLREVFCALAEVADFPPATLLWNAAHPDVPLHCFFRVRREPVFRIASLELRSGRVSLVVEHGAAGRGKATRRHFELARDAAWNLRVAGGEEPLTA